MGAVLEPGRYHRETPRPPAAWDCTRTSPTSQVLRPTLTIIDASRALTTNGPKGPGEVKQTNTIIASHDMVLADTLGIGLLTTPWTTSPTSASPPQPAQAPRTSPKPRSPASDRAGLRRNGSGAHGPSGGGAEPRGLAPAPFPSPNPPPNPHLSTTSHAAQSLFHRSMHIHPQRPLCRCAPARRGNAACITSLPRPRGTATCALTLTLLAFSCAAAGWSATADRTVSVDPQGVLRWQDDGSEVALFGVNYYVPFAIDYATIGARGARPRAGHPRRRHPLRAPRPVAPSACTAGTARSATTTGNLMDNEHLRLLD